MSMFSNAMIASVAMTAVLSASAASAAVVTAGTITGLGGDTLSDPFGDGSLYNFIDAANPDGIGTDGTLHLLLDLGSVQDIDKIHIINRVRDGGDWPLNVASLNVLVAADESDIGFDPEVLGSFVTQVYSGTLNPASQASGAAQTADLTGSWERRYFLLDFTATYMGAIDGNAETDTNIAQFSDIQVEVVPEPASAALLLIGAGLMARRRR